MRVASSAFLRLPDIHDKSMSREKQFSWRASESAQDARWQNSSARSVCLSAVIPAVRRTGQFARGRDEAFQIAVAGQSHHCWLNSGVDGSTLGVRGVLFASMTIGALLFLLTPFLTRENHFS